MSYPADWYPDPAGDPNLVRYWDGTQWTEHTQPMHQPAPPVAEPVQQPAAYGAEVAADPAAYGAEVAAEPAAYGAEVAAEPDPYTGDVPAESAYDPDVDATVVFSPQQAAPTEDQPAPPVVDAQPAPPVVDAQPAPPVVDAQPAPPGVDAQPAPPVVEHQPAPPVAQPAPPQPVAAAPGGDGIAGIRSDLLSGAYAESDANERVILQNTKMLKVRLGEPVLARQGSMVAFQGQVDFDHEGAGGVGKFLKKAATGEGVPLMRCSGQGEVFFASDADQVHILHLDGSALSVNGKNILAFESTLEWDIQRVQGAGVITGGLFNTRLSGHGWVAITTKGQPVVLRTDQPTFGDPDAVVAWSANLQTSLNKTVKAKAFVGLGSGEAFQVAFAGQGIVIVQPSEGGVAAHTH